MRRQKKVKIPRAGPGTGIGRRLLKCGLVLLVAGAAGAGAVYGLWHLRDRLGADPSYVVWREDLSLVSGPPWMTPAMRADLDIRALAPDLPEVFSLLDPGVCERLAAAYGKSPWIERVDRIEKRDPRADPGRRLEISLTFRRPAAFVSHRGGFYLVDGQGVRLPGAYREPKLRDCGPARDEIELLVITGVKEAPPDPGRVWPEPAVLAGLRVAEGLAPRREQFRLKSIVLSSDPRRSEVTVYTARDTEIRWGKAPTPQAARLQEKTVAEKVEYLEYVHKCLGDFDGVLEYIDIPNEVYRRRASPADYPLRS